MVEWRWRSLAHAFPTPPTAREKQGTQHYITYDVAIASKVRSAVLLARRRGWARPAIMAALPVQNFRGG